jgi:hypothetical protein
VGEQVATARREAAVTTGDVWSMKCEVLAGCERVGGRTRG